VGRAEQTLKVGRVIGVVGAAKFGLPDCGTFVPSQILLISGQRGCIEALLISFEDYYTAFL
jgi:hypothetical protein